MQKRPFYIKANMNPKIGDFVKAMEKASPVYGVIKKDVDDKFIIEFHSTKLDDNIFHPTGIEASIHKRFVVQVGLAEGEKIGEMDYSHIEFFNNWKNKIKACKSKI